MANRSSKIKKSYYHKQYEFQHPCPICFTSTTLRVIVVSTLKDLDVRPCHLPDLRAAELRCKFCGFEIDSRGYQVHGTSSFWHGIECDNKHRIRRPKLPDIWLEDQVNYNFIFTHTDVLNMLTRGTVLPIKTWKRRYARGAWLNTMPLYDSIFGDPNVRYGA